ncbi:MAG: M23 family metallopeptidase [Oscillospiraceae bacterium]|nr:M23 family metallopeptidase [Oscillospiraceae bacterium]
MTEIEVLQDEFQASRDELDTALSDTNVEIEFITKQQQYAEGELAQQKQALEQIEAEEEEMIQKAIREAMEEEERQKAAEAAKHTTKATTVTTVPTTKATTKTTTTTTTTAAPVITEAPAVVPEPETPATQAPPVVTEAPATQPPVTQAPAPVTTAPTTAAPAPATTQAPPTGSMFAWPCPGHYGISSPFGPRWGRNHSGIDIIGNVTAINGAAACAAGNGKVIRVVSDGWGGGYGNNVVIYHGNGYSTLYAHLQRPTVSVGQQVTVGQQIGVVGSTGNSTGPHLHFEVRINDSPVNPMPYLP